MFGVVLRRRILKSVMLPSLPSALAIRPLCNIRESQSVIVDCQQILESIEPLNEKSRGPLDKSTNKNTIFPFVFLLGNHSSGKSSFVNYILNRKVQTAGVAPTDDSFTIIAPGPRDVDRDGPSFIGDPDMGFSGLKSFGPTLIHHTQLKVRSNTAITDFMIVDTPGMIDSPLIRESYNSNQSQKSPSSSHDEASRQYHRSMINANMDRGYNFEDVIKWYAERADVILLFFDPDKPGTTGETLSILTNSLQGMDHKLHIILNKADQFKRIHDFARAYGSLCWNLSKVIPRKDLPRIYTMCLPTAYQAASSGDQSTDEQHNLGQGLADLEATREEVVKEVLNTPRRREDNDITRLTEKVHLLQMHCTILDDLLSTFHHYRWKYRMTIFGTVAFALTTTGSSALLSNSSPQIMAAVASANILTLLGVHYWQSTLLKNKARELIAMDGRHGIESVFKRLYSRKIADSDEYTMDLWRKVKYHFEIGWIREEDIESMKRISESEFKLLNYILETDVPSLRRRTAPELTNAASHQPLSETRKVNSLLQSVLEGGSQNGDRER